jgi:di/tricarboxylate transporter
VTERASIDRRVPAERLEAETVALLARGTWAALAELGVPVLPVLPAVNLAAVASFLTPVAAPANLLVQEPGAYRFGDSWRLGLPLLFVLAATVLVPLLWPF